MSVVTENLPPPNGKGVAHAKTMSCINQVEKLPNLFLALSSVTRERGPPPAVPFHKVQDYADQKGCAARAAYDDRVPSGTDRQAATLLRMGTIKYTIA